MVPACDKQMFDELFAMAGGNFKAESVKFFGGIGCTFILNGMVFRDPTARKILHDAFLIESRKRHGAFFPGVLVGWGRDDIMAQLRVAIAAVK